jgi:hypothetical protein
MGDSRDFTGLVFRFHGRSKKDVLQLNNRDLAPIKNLAEIAPTNGTRP